MPRPKRILTRLAVIIAVLSIIIVIWFAKNRPGTKKSVSPVATAEVAVQTSLAKDPSTEPPEPAVEQIPVVAKITDPNPDFALYATEPLDLEKLRSYGLPIMIDFGADSCIPCKEMAPILKDLNARLQGKAIIRFVDVWKNQKLSEGFPIRVIPTQIFFDSEGKPYRPSDPGASNMLMYVLKDTEEHVFTAHEGGMTEDMILHALQEMGLSHD
ncbi:MAG: thioredoxin family protein [Sphaerochaeta sp.]|jgi:thioredoxin 1|nr:thioredoxin family protein [Sphaerochaeta sp.]